MSSHNPHPHDKELILLTICNALNCPRAHARAVVNALEQKGIRLVGPTPTSAMTMAAYREDTVIASLTAALEAAPTYGDKT